MRWGGRDMLSRTLESGGVDEDWIRFVCSKGGYEYDY